MRENFKYFYKALTLTQKQLYFHLLQKIIKKQNSKGSNIKKKIMT